MINKNNITDVSLSYMCSNCGACSAICPTNAITFNFTNIGRYPAVIDEKKCISCKLCRKVCPSLDEQKIIEKFNNPFIGDIKKVLVGRCNNDNLFLNAQSGGACSATISYLFSTNKIDAAIVCEMKIGNPPKIVATIITEVQEVKNSQKSCYTPVSLLSILPEIKKFKSVAIVGLPCHIEGIESLQRLSKFSNIKYRLGLVCDRTLCNYSMEFFGKLANFSTEFKIIWKYKLLNFKNKIYNYKEAPLTLINRNGFIKVFPNTYRFLIKDIFTPPRCWVCYDKINNFADIVFGDPWRMSNIDEINGSSLMIVRTEIGSQLIEDLKQAKIILMSERPIEELIKGQLINERKKQVSRFSKALQVLPHKINSYLYTQALDINNSKEEIQKSRQILHNFTILELKSKSYIFKKVKKHLFFHYYIKKYITSNIRSKIKILLNIK